MPETEPVAQTHAPSSFTSRPGPPSAEPVFVAREAAPGLGARQRPRRRGRRPPPFSPRRTRLASIARTRALLSDMPGNSALRDEREPDEDFGFLFSKEPKKPFYHMGKNF